MKIPTKAILSEFDNTQSRLNEILEAVKARKGPAFSLALHAAASNTHNIHQVETMTRFALTGHPEADFLTETLDSILQDTINNTLNVAVCHAYNVRLGTPEFAACAKAFTSELEPLINELHSFHQRAAKLTDSI